MNHCDTWYHHWSTYVMSSQHYLERCNILQVMSHDALRMRLRRLCEIKPRSKKCHVDSATHDQYMRGGESREWLEIALTEALDKLGSEKNQHKKLRAPRLHLINAA